MVTKPKFSGPILPGSSESYFRDFGVTIREDAISSPLSGKISPSGGGGGGGVSSPVVSGITSIVERQPVDPIQQIIQPTQPDPISTPISQPAPKTFVEQQAESLRDTSPIPTDEAGRPDRFGGTVVTEADDSFRSFVKDRNLFTGSLAFAGEKARGLFGRFERKQAPRGQELASTPFIPTIIETAPFLNPLTGPGALVLTGVGAVLPSGRRESKRVGESIEETTGIPAPIGSIGFTGLQVGGGVVGGFGVVKQTERALGLPKFDVKFRAKQTAKIGDDMSSTISGGVIKRKGLLSEREAVFATEGLTKIDKTMKLDAPFFEFKSVGRGVSREFRGVQPTGRKVFGKPKPFGSQVSGFGKRGKQTISSDIAKVEVEGFDFVGTGRQKIFPKGEPTESLILGKGFQLPSGTVTASKFAPLERKAFETGLEKVGRGTTFGISKPLPQFDKGVGTVIKGRGSVSKSINEQILSSTIPKQVFPTQDFTKAGGLIGGTALVKPRIEVEPIKAPRVEQVNVQKQFETLKFDTGIAPKEKTRTKTIQVIKSKSNQISNQLLGTSSAQPTKQGLGLGLAQPQAVKTRQKQTTKQITKSPLAFDFPVPPIIPKGRLFPPFLIPPLPGFTKFPRKKPTGKRRLRRTPSTISFALGLKETPFKFGLKEERSGLISRGLVSPSRRRRKKSMSDVLSF